MGDEKFLCDKEVAALLQISHAKLRKMVNKGATFKGIDLRDAKPVLVGCCRRWPRAKLYKMLGLEE